jgi:hypothetical protein
VYHNLCEVWKRLHAEPITGEACHRPQPLRPWKTPGAPTAAGRASADHALIGGRGDFDRDLQGLAVAPCFPCGLANPPRAAVLLLGRPLLHFRAPVSSSTHRTSRQSPTLCHLPAWIGSKDARDWPHTGKPAAIFAARIPSRTLDLHPSAG